MSMEDGQLAEETLDISGPRGVLSSRTPKTNKKEREEALKELLLQSKAKADMQRIRNGFRATFDENATLMDDRRTARDHKKQETRLTTTEKGTDTDKLRQSRTPDSNLERSRTKTEDKNFNTQQNASIIKKDTLAQGFRPQTGEGMLRTSQIPSDASRRRLKKLSEFSGSKEEGTRSKEDVVDLENPPYKAQTLVSNTQIGTMLKEDRGHHYGGRYDDSDDLIGQLGDLSIGKQSKDRDKSNARPHKKRDDFDQVLKVSRQQSLPDEDVAITEPERKQWTDWPEPSRQGESRKSAYVDLDKWKKHQGREHAGGLRVSDGRAPPLQSVDHASRRGEHLSHQAFQAVQKQTGQVQSLEDDDLSSSSNKPAQRTPSASGVSASRSEEREARDEKGRERVEAVLAKDRDALVLGKGRYVLPGRVASQLYPHQRESIEWLWSLHVKKTGGILGDDMGLGKTMQIASYLTGLFHSRLIRCVLVVAPKTLLAQWELELTDKCRLGRQVLSYHEGSTNERARNLRHTLQHGGILLTTYGMIQHNAIPLSGQDPEIGKDGYGEMADDMVTWDYVVLDEGHQIKNEKTVKAKNLRSIPARHRLIVSGTPVQNNLQEMWSLFDFCCPGLLGDSRSFKEEYERKITTGQNRDASERQRHVGVVTSQNLRSVIAPFFLRREKKDVIKTPNPGAGTNPASSAPDPKAHATGRRQMDMSAQKNDLIVWLKPTPEQKRLYVSFLQSEQVKKVFNEKRSALAALTVLKKICDHPLLLTERAASEIARGASRAAQHAVAEGHADLSVDELTEGDAAAAAEMALAIASARGISIGEGGSAKETSCKVLFLMELLEDLVWNGHRTLVFSQSKKMLDIIQVEVIARSFRFCRIDGGIVSAKERQKLVQEFQTDPDIPVFLLTSQVGGLGLTLTAADRVVIVDPAWNPSVDNQSVDRAYRIGQKRDVVVYRLITSGTIEEKIYCKQVFKGGLMRAVTEHKDYKKMFNEHELTALFSIPERGFEYSETMERLQKSQAGVINTTPELNQHISRLETRGIVGVSHHDLLFKEEAEDVPIVATVDTFTARPTSAASRRQVVDLTARGSRKGGLTSRPTPIGARVERIDLLSEAHAYLRSDSESGFKGSGGSSSGFRGLGCSSANPWTVPEEVPEPSTKQKEAELEAAAKRRMEALAQELKKAERLLNTQALSLPDGGEKIKQKIRRLSDQLSEAQVAATKPLSPELPKAPQLTPLNGQTAGTQNPDSNPQNPNPQTLKPQTLNPWRPNPQDPSFQMLNPQNPANTQRQPLDLSRGGVIAQKTEGHVPPKAPKVGEANLGWESSSSSLSSGEGYASASSTGWCSDAASCHGAAMESVGTVPAEVRHATGRPKFQRDHRVADVRREPGSVDFEKGPKVVNLQTDQQSEGSEMDSGGLQTGQRDPSGLNSVTCFERDLPGVGSRTQNEWAEELAVKVAALSSSVLLPRRRDQVQDLETATEASSENGETGLTARSNPVENSVKHSSGLVATVERDRTSLVAEKDEDAGSLAEVHRTDGAESKQAPVKLAWGIPGEPAKATARLFERPEVLDGAVGFGEMSGGGFETPARCGGAQGPQFAGARGPQSGLKLRASLRKRREEGGAVNDSPPGGMPTFDLGLDDMDDVADKLGSMSVV